MMLINKHLVPEGIANIRLQEYAYIVFKEFIPSKKGIKKAILKSRILINEQVGLTGDWITAGMELSLLEELNIEYKAYEFSLEVLYEDDQLAVVNKPSGMVVSGNVYKSVQNCLPYNLKISSAKDKLTLVRPVHRLDKATSGCLVVAKTKSAQVHLHRAFESQEVKKNYHALVHGECPIEGNINFPIRGKKASTSFKRIALYNSLSHDKISHLSLFPKTGRTHQLRIHASMISHSIIGDRLYRNNEKLQKGKGLFLHAKSILFESPLMTGELRITSKLPSKFEKYLEKEMNRWHKFRK